MRETRKKLQKLILDLFDQLWFIVVVSVVLPVVSAVVGSVVGLELFSLILRMLQKSIERKWTNERRKKKTDQRHHGRFEVAEEGRHSYSEWLDTEMKRRER